MEIRITGTEKELADFVLRIQNQQVLWPGLLKIPLDKMDDAFRRADAKMPINLDFFNFTD